MRILMLGWEFPPFIAGGLGTACFGLTKALDRRGHKVLFVLPRAVDGAQQTHVQLIGPQPIVSRTRTHPASHAFTHTSFIEVDAPFSSPYPQFDEDAPGRGPATHRVDEHGVVVEEGEEHVHVEHPEPVTHHYGSDLVGDAARYARQVLAIAQKESFDVIHAHDWLTYPAGLAARAATGKPLVCHVHATEFDRSGDSVNQQVYEIERAGMHGCDRVIAVSALTKSICATRYSVPADKIQVVYNGVDQDSQQPGTDVVIRSTDRIVLFLGRITMQKGPEYFIRAAARVLEKEKNVKFVVAGSGDMALGMIEHAASLGIGHKVLFTGFLRGRDVERVFRMADCYVMPSVSEPFGIAALEAIQHDTPVIISKQSGVSEVLTHALKVDFWDVEEMANKIVAVLRYPPLSQTLRAHGTFEVRGLSWDGAAEKCARTYEALAQRSPGA